MTDDNPRSRDSSFLLPERVRPVPDPTGLDTEYWTGAMAGRLVVQRCNTCQSWQWGPEWMCYRCQSLDVGWAEVPNTWGEYHGVIYSWERSWHPTDTALEDSVPYVVLLVELPEAGGVRMVGNLVGDQRTEVGIGDPVRAVFEHHTEFSLVHWELR